MYNCAEKRASVCGARLSSVDRAAVTAIPIPQSDGCKPWGFGLHDRCYYFGEDPISAYGSRPVNTYDAARQFCRSNYNGSDLAVLWDKDSLAFVNAFVTRFASDYWIGLRAGPSSWNAYNQWNDNSYVYGTNWAHDEPKTLPSGAKGCVAVYGSITEFIIPGDWYVADCSLPKFAICEGPRDFHPTHPPPMTTLRPLGCPAGWSTQTYSFEEQFPSCYKVKLTDD